MKRACVVSLQEHQIAYQEDVDRTGKLLPKNGREYIVVITKDNPDIASLVTEKRLFEQAIKEFEKQLGYGIKIFHQFEYNKLANTIDVLVEWKDKDQFFKENTIAWAGFPIGSLRGRMVFNNKFPLLDGQPRTGSQLRSLGIILPNMRDNILYETINVKQVIKHEFGHILGLQHENDDESVMFFAYGFDRVMLSSNSKDILNSKYGKDDFIKRALPDFYIKAVMIRPLFL